MGNTDRAVAPLAHRRMVEGRGLVSERTRPVVENDEYGAFARRIVAAHGRRVGAGDVEGLRDLAKLRDAIDAAIVGAVAGLVDQGHTYSEMAEPLGVRSRQAVQQRYGRKA